MHRPLFAISQQGIAIFFGVRMSVVFSSFTVCGVCVKGVYESDKKGARIEVCCTAMT